MNEIFTTLATAAAAGERVALGILIRVTGSSPQRTGAKAVFHLDKKISGTLGGGCLEAEAQRLALNALKTGRAETFELILDHDFGWDDGLICGGKVFGVVIPDVQLAGEKFWNELALRDNPKTWGVKKDFSIARVEDESPHAAAVPSINYQPSTIHSSDWLYTEIIQPKCALWIAGSGHIAQAVAPLALQLDFDVTVFDDRPDLANHRLFPEAVRFHVGDWSGLLGGEFMARRTFGLIVTRGHKHDALVLESWIHRPFEFLGMIGSARKARTIAEHFVRKRIATAEQVARVACPVGIEIASESVPEIAVSIMAQYIEKRAVSELR
jgi:xanthine dehydrogenase accessory factor